MSLHRYAARADSTAQEIRDGLRAAGWYVYDLRKPFDFLCGKGGRTELVEGKSPGGTLTAAQTRFLCEWPGKRPVFGRSSKEVLLQLEPKGAHCAEVIHPDKGDKA